MMQHDFELGSSRKLGTIAGYEFRDPKGSKKLYLHVTTDDGKKYTINEVWIENRDGETVTQGLWLDLDHTGRLCDRSVLGRLLTLVGANSITGLVNKQVYIEPKPNGFMSIVLSPK